MKFELRVIRSKCDRCEEWHYSFGEIAVDDAGAVLYEEGVLGPAAFELTNTNNTNLNEIRRGLTVLLEVIAKPVEDLAVFVAACPDGVLAIAQKRLEIKAGDGSGVRYPEMTH